MHSLAKRLAAVFTVGFMMVGFLAIPSAEAQTYPPVFPGAVDCDTLAAPTIEIIGSEIVVTFPQGTLTCILRVIIQVNPVLFDGPPPTSGVLALPVPAIVGDSHSVSVTTYSGSGEVVVGSGVPIPVSALAAARAARATNAAGTASGAPATAAATTSVPVPAQNLAFTGGNVNLPLAAGAILIGAGGITLLVARKREETA